MAGALRTRSWASHCVEIVGSTTVSSILNIQKYCQLINPRQGGGRNENDIISEQWQHVILFSRKKER